jgi:hypothetical protein
MVQSEHFCAADLWDEEAGKFQNAIVKIVKVTAGKVTGQKGRTKGLPFLTLENRRGKVLRAPFGANPTNCSSIGSALGSPDVKNWIGRWIHLYVTKVDSPEGMVDAIRIHPKAPADPTKNTTEAAGKTEKQELAPANLNDDDKRAIAAAEAEEARRGG